MPIDKAQVELQLLGRARPVDLYTLSRPDGMRTKILALGGALVTLEVPDRQGRLADVTLGFDPLDGYVQNPPFLGALIGRFGNRIARGAFNLDGVTHRVATNDGPNHLHGGPGGFHAVIWEVTGARDGAEPALSLRHVSPDGEEGYPGTLEVAVTYTLTSESGLRVAYEARTDRATIVNLTQHAYFNLAGHAAGSILDHHLRLAAARFLPVDATLIPTGELRPVAGSPFDFREATAIGARIGADDEQLRRGHGYDHCYVVDGWDGALRPIAEVTEPRSGRRMLMRTTEPGVQLYTGNHLAGTAGKGGNVYGARTGFCLEAQRFPDAPNQPGFPTARLAPGEVYRQTTEYVFTTG